MLTVLTVHVLVLDFHAKTARMTFAIHDEPQTDAPLFLK